jgi:PAS domain S-box-containing protein
MNRPATLTLSWVIFIAALGWAFLADRLIRSVATRLEPRHIELMRSLNGLIVVALVFMFLYRLLKKQQNSLRVAAEDYRRLFEDIPAPMFIYDQDTYRFLAVNRAAELQYGYTREELLSLMPVNLRLRGQLKSLWDSHESLAPEHFESACWLHEDKSGNSFYVCVYTCDTFFEGKPAKQALVINIDEKVKAKQALQKKKEELENVLETMTDAFYTVDKHWNFTYINKEYEKVQDRRRENLLGKNVWELFPYGKRLCFYREYEKAMREQVSVHFEEYNPDNGMWVSAHAYPIETGLAIYFRDITPEKQMQQRLYHDRQNLRAIINNTRDLIWSVDKDFHIITGNEPFWERAEKVTGKTKDNISNEDFEKSLMAGIIASYRRAFRGEAFTTVRKRDKPGFLYEELSFNPIVDQHQVIGVNCFLRDITQQQLQLEQIRSQNEKLKEIAWLQSHQVRAPLANMLGLIDCMGPEADQEVMERIKKNSQHLDQVIRDMTARIESEIELLR